MVVVGDTQRAIPVERWLLRRETNDAARSRVARAFLDAPSDARVHLGDLVGRVGAPEDWARFDRDYPAARLAERPLLVCRGNHDVTSPLFGRDDAFRARFPAACAGLQRLDVGPLRLIAFDTNRGALGARRWEAQRGALASALDAARDDVSVAHVVVLAHHPPFTNGRWHPPRDDVREALWAPLRACGKVRACLSGHVHGYERFTVDGVRFVVSGGGGGARFSHTAGAAQRTKADVCLPDPHPFHYLVLTAREDALRVEVRGFDAPDAPWRTVDAW